MLQINTSAPPIFSETSCPVCYRPLVEPVKLPCSHHFCLSCVKTLLSTTPEPDPFRCPFCRRLSPRSISLKIDEQMAKIAQEKNPLEFEKWRLVLLEAHKAESDKIKITLNYGCISGFAQNNTLKPALEWTVFLKLAPSSSKSGIFSFIEEVKFISCPSNKTTVFKRPPFEINGVGIGTKSFGVKVRWRPELKKEPQILFLDVERTSKTNCLVCEFDKKLLETSLKTSNTKMVF